MEEAAGYVVLFLFARSTAYFYFCEIIFSPPSVGMLCVSPDETRDHLMFY